MKISKSGKASLPTSRKIPDTPYEPVIKKHASMIGEIAWAWNQLHVSYLSVFAFLIDKRDHRIGLNLWHSCLSDKNQRTMLAAVINAKLLSNNKRNNKRLNEILWSCHVTNDLSGYRNAFVHAPIRFKWDKDTKVKPMVSGPEVAPAFAKKLSDKELSEVYEKVIGDLLALDKFVTGVYFSMSSPSVWSSPDRPSLQALPENTQAKSQKSRPKQRRRPRP